MAESSRDRIAYFIWCAKRGYTTQMMRTTDNYLLRPPEEFTAEELLELASLWKTADLILEMLQSDILELVRGGEDGLVGWNTPWSEGVTDCLKILGWNDPRPECKEEYCFNKVLRDGVVCGLHI